MDPASSPLSSPCSITAVVVLYKQAPSESVALSALFQILKSHPELAEHFSLVIYDNSPERQICESTANFPTHYLHDPVNGGLASAYNYALAQAEQLKHEWLLLFDHDTSPTYEFFAELIACANVLHTQSDIAAIVPKLLVQGEIFSPQEPFLNIVQRPFSRVRRVLDRQDFGIPNRQLSAWNSGAALRVSALRAIGGFPREFWLDYLDYAVFHALATSGYRMYVMRAMLEHDFSQSDLNSTPLWRHRNILMAQTLFVKQAGSFADRLLYRIWLLRSSAFHWLRCQDRRVWKEAALQSIWLKTPEAAPNCADRSRTNQNAPS